MRPRLASLTCNAEAPALHLDPGTQLTWLVLVLGDNMQKATLRMIAAAAAIAAVIATVARFLS